LQAGTTLALMSIGWPLASMFSSKLMSKTSYRFTALLGAILLTSGSLLLLLLSPQSGLWWARLSAFLIGSGMGLCNTTFLVSVQNAAAIEIRGIATASTFFTRMLGSAIGTSLLGATLNTNLQWRLPQVTDPIQKLMDRVQRQQMDTSQLNSLIWRVAESLHWVFIIGALIAVMSIAAALLLPKGQRPEGHK